MIDQRQVWHDFTRYLIADEYGSVQVDAFDKEMQWREWDAKGSAFLYALWVDEGHRKNGHAKRLLNRAEEVLREAGHKSVFLEWLSVDTPKDVLLWYKRCGYIERECHVIQEGDSIILLEKML